MTRYADVEELPQDAQLLDANSSAERWSTGPEDSQWFCARCGVALEDEEAGCDDCGEGCLSDVDAAQYDDTVYDDATGD